MSSEVDIAADRAIIAAATPGPWQVPAVNHRLVVAPTPSPQGSLTTIGNFYDGDYASADAGFAAAARTRWPAALDEIERLRAKLATHEATIGEQDAEIDSLRSLAWEMAESACERGQACDANFDTAVEIARCMRKLRSVKEATIGELRAGLENLRGAVAGVFDFGACYGSRRDFERAASAADALLAKTAPAKEGT